MEAWEGWLIAAGIGALIPLGLLAYNWTNDNAAAYGWDKPLTPRGLAVIALRSLVALIALSFLGSFLWVFVEAAAG